MNALECRHSSIQAAACCIIMHTFIIITDRNRNPTARTSTKVSVSERRPKCAWAFSMNCRLCHWTDFINIIALQTLKATTGCSRSSSSNNNTIEIINISNNFQRRRRGRKRSSNFLHCLAVVNCLSVRVCVSGCGCGWVGVGVCMYANIC